MPFIVILLILTIVVLFVTAPLRRPGGEGEAAGDRNGRRSELLELQAAREAKYREIRDAELDHRTGKLSDEDFEALDSTLRAEAAEILRGLDTATGSISRNGSAETAGSATIERR